MSTLFLGDSEFLHTCSARPPRDLTSEGEVGSFLFSAEYVWSKEVKIAQIILLLTKNNAQKKKLGQVIVKAHRRRLQHSESDLKKRRGIWPGNKFPSFNLRPIFFKFSVDFITVLPAGNNNGTPFKHRPKRGNGRGTRWGRYTSCRVSSVV